MAWGAFCPKRSLLSSTRHSRKPQKNSLPQTLGKTDFDVDTYLAATDEPDILATRSIGQSGLFAVIGCGAATDLGAQTVQAHIGPKPPLVEFVAAMRIPKAASQELDETSDTGIAHSNNFRRLLSGKSILMNNSWPSNIADAFPS